MYGGYDLSTIMPILAAVFFSVIIIVVIIVNGKTKQTENLAINQKAFEELAFALKADNEVLKAELASMKETLNSINKMMKEIG